MRYSNFLIENAYSNIFPDFTSDQTIEAYTVLENSIDQWMSELSGAMEASGNPTQDELDKLASRGRAAARKMKAAKESGNRRAMMEAKKELDQVNKEIVEAEKNVRDAEKKKKIKKVAAIVLASVAAITLGYLGYKALKNKGGKPASAPATTSTTSSSSSSSNSSSASSSSANVEKPKAELEKQVASGKKVDPEFDKNMGDKSKKLEFGPNSTQEKHAFVQAQKEAKVAEKAATEPDKDMKKAADLCRETTQASQAFLALPTKGESSRSIIDDNLKALKSRQIDNIRSERKNDLEHSLLIKRRNELNDYIDTISEQPKTKERDSKLMELLTKRDRVQEAIDKRNNAYVDREIDVYKE